MGGAAELEAQQLRRYAADSKGCPHAHVYVSPCGHGFSIRSWQPQSEFEHVRIVPASFAGMYSYYPLSYCRYLIGYWADQCQGSSGRLRKPNRPRWRSPARASTGRVSPWGDGTTPPAIRRGQDSSAPGAAACRTSRGSHLRRGTGRHRRTPRAALRAVRDICVHRDVPHRGSGTFPLRRATVDPVRPRPAIRCGSASSRRMRADWSRSSAWKFAALGQPTLDPLIEIRQEGRLLRLRGTSRRGQWPSRDGRHCECSARQWPPFLGAQAAPHAADLGC